MPIFADGVLMQSPEELLKIHANLIAAQKAMFEEYDGVPTSEYGLAWREFTIATAVFAHVQKHDDSSKYQEALVKMLNQQRAFIRAQIDLLMRNNVYGDQ
jgi:hypothetical protein